jgi:hypothetical protein
LPPNWLPFLNLNILFFLFGIKGRVRLILTTFCNLIA